MIAAAGLGDHAGGEITVGSHDQRENATERSDRRFPHMLEIGQRRRGLVEDAFPVGRSDNVTGADPQRRGGGAGQLPQRAGRIPGSARTGLSGEQVNAALNLEQRLPRRKRCRRGRGGRPDQDAAQDRDQSQRHRARASRVGDRHRSHVPRSRKRTRHSSIPGVRDPRRSPRAIGTPLRDGPW
jgi:hypothetical protein